MRRKRRNQKNDVANSDEGASTYQAIVDTPKGSRNKYKLDEETTRFKLASVLTAGAVFPYDFGYLPGTRGEDGDALDVLILMDEPAFVGCQLEVRLIGVIEAEQTEKGKTIRNDRLVAVAVESHLFKDVRELSELGNRLLDQIEHFFVSYNEAKGKEFKPTARSGAMRVETLLDEGERNYRKSKR